LNIKRLPEWGNTHKISMGSDEQLEGPILAHADLMLLASIVGNGVKGSNVSSRGLRSVHCNRQQPLTLKNCDSEIAAPANGY
jgi:hypothetical protein